MNIYRAKNTGYGARWIFAKSEKSAHKIGVACGMVRHPKNLTITKISDTIFENTDAKEVKVEGIGTLWANNDGKGEWQIINKNGIVKQSTSVYRLIC